MSIQWLLLKMVKRQNKQSQINVQRGKSLKVRSTVPQCSAEFFAIFMLIILVLLIHCHSSHELGIGPQQETV